MTTRCRQLVWKTYRGILQLSQKYININSSKRQKKIGKKRVQTCTSDKNATTGENPNNAKN